MPVVRSLAGAVNAKGELTVSFASLHQLCLSYLAILAEGERLAVAMLDFVPEDCRDGLLLACYRLNTAAIYDKVKACVRQWAGEDWCGGSTGEGHLIARMVRRWDETFPGGDHEDVRGIVSVGLR